MVISLAFSLQVIFNLKFEKCHCKNMNILLLLKKLLHKVTYIQMVTFYYNLVIKTFYKRVNEVVKVLT